MRQSYKVDLVGNSFAAHFPSHYSNCASFGLIILTTFFCAMLLCNSI